MADTIDAAPEAPTAQQIAAVRAHLRDQALATADGPRAAKVELVTSEAFAEVWGLMLAAQTADPGDTELNYAISMFARLRSSYTPA